MALYSCGDITHEYIYPENVNISNANGEPVDSLSFFFPLKLNYKDSLIKTDLDTFDLMRYSSQLFPSKEPILFNYYLGHEIYRFIWLQSFDNPIILTLNKKADDIWLTIKKLDRQPEYIATQVIQFVYPPKAGKPYDSTKKIDLDKYPIRQPNRKAKLAVNRTKKLSEAEWNEFERILARVGYWEMSPTQRIIGIDGSQWIIEAHAEHKYWIVDRWSPEDDYKEAGLYLINLSGLLNEEIN